MDEQADSFQRILRVRSRSDVLAQHVLLLIWWGKDGNVNVQYRDTIACVFVTVARRLGGVWPRAHKWPAQGTVDGQTNDVLIRGSARTCHGDAIEELHVRVCVCVCVFRGEGGTRAVHSQGKAAHTGKHMVLTCVELMLSMCSLSSFRMRMVTWCPFAANTWAMPVPKAPPPNTTQFLGCLVIRRGLCLYSASISFSSLADCACVDVCGWVWVRGCVGG